MSIETKNSGKFEYAEAGEGHPLVLLHGLMGGLSNFDDVFHYFSRRGYRVLIPKLPLYTLPLLNTNVSSLASYVVNFIKELKIAPVTLIGNSLGGHISLIITKNHPELVHSLVLTGSSGLYENAMGDSFPRRGDYQYVANKTKDVFYNKEVATKELIDEVYSIVNDRNKVLRTLSISKSAIRHNMAKDLVNMKLPVCIIWGENDNVTPPDVAKRFHDLLPNSDLYWIPECGHAAMMERPLEFNQILEKWLEKVIVRSNAG
ncbi:alpha/beta fold hydrolase [Schleiferia thermophila]|uniref:Pimeloyl-ACP methyl ester carboxylesterase n=1 Tax=Schleiferia thermophila TaxID=884107 RepID=A0A369A8W5_9FLAO|nr:alpha/beta hydrolase [Schleiferia thermophila]KFD38782.1 alpha/beta hydrolase [Schleiferia thermophila str. Yellowstone]PMB35881.1 alpha/beta hydrolase [Fischerella thermalis CCMEE 5319]RCX04756.1 pimeloyl-ACP methyl ester carboxylesterase [Schleiferia thermophila]GCD79715.1 alpha/beta hydrolase [Schleiferia thermophila]